MSGTNYLLDSNFIIDLSKNKVDALTFLPNLTNNIAVSVISYMEVLGYDFKEPKELDMINELLNSMDVVYLTENIVNDVISIKRKNKIKLPDAIIAATATINDYVLVTANIDDFKKISGLTLLNYML